MTRCEYYFNQTGRLTLLLIWFLSRFQTQKKRTRTEKVQETQFVEHFPSNNFADRADVVFHEACHAVWERNKLPARLHKSFAKYSFDKDYQVMNESLATVLGQGLFVQTTFPQSKIKEIWYGNEIIDAFAHGLLPLVKEYFDSGRSIDAAFAKQADKVFIESKTPS